MAFNYTSDLPPLPNYTLTPQPSLLPFISDSNLTIVAPIIVYWITSLFFHIIDTWDLFPQYRLHTPKEILSRNHVSRWEVLRDVVIQHIIQGLTALVISLFEDTPTSGKEDYDIAIWAQRIRLIQRAIPWIFGVFGLNTASLSGRLGSSGTLVSVLSGGKYPQLNQTVHQGENIFSVPAFASWELQVASGVYWYLIPAIQLLGAFMILDTWQYFWHRAMHLNKWLYTTFHSRHHRLYVPYAFGALYNHPFEGFIMDTAGSGIAYFLTAMSTRQGMFFFVISMIKTIDDHCGYAFPWDPFQHVTGNNAAYHDIHHQSWGIKTNFSQPWFTIWDYALGTVWKGGDVKLKYEKSRKAADEWWETQQKLKENSQVSEEQKKPQDVSAVLEPSYTEPSKSVRRSPRKTSKEIQLKELRNRMVNGNSLHNSVPRVDSHH